MVSAYLTLITAVANAGAAIADFARAKFVLANSAELGIPRSWLPPLAALKAAGAVGLLAGLAGIPLVGIAAAAGLTLFFIGAVGVHVRARVFHNIAIPVCLLALAAVSVANFV
jgi:hypothetical protein